MNPVLSHTPLAYKSIDLSFFDDLRGKIIQDPEKGFTSLFGKDFDEKQSDPFEKWVFDLLLIPEAYHSSYPEDAFSRFENLTIKNIGSQNLLAILLTIYQINQSLLNNSLIQKSNAIEIKRILKSKIDELYKAEALDFLDLNSLQNLTIDKSKVSLDFSHKLDQIFSFSEPIRFKSGMSNVETVAFAMISLFALFKVSQFFAKEQVNSHEGHLKKIGETPPRHSIHVRSFPNATNTLVWPSCPVNSNSLLESNPNKKFSYIPSLSCPANSSLALEQANNANLKDDLETAKKLYLNAISGGLYSASNGLFNIGYHYFTHTEKNYKLALESFHEAAKYHNNKALYYLGVCFEHGYGTEPNFEKARVFYTDSAKLGSEEAQERLINLYAKETNYKLSNLWVHEKAQNGDPYSMYRLGINYLNGKGVKQSDSEGSKWILLAADAGDTEAQKVVSFLIESGIITNSERGSYWHENYLRTLKIKQTEDQIKSIPIKSNITDNFNNTEPAKDLKEETSKVDTSKDSSPDSNTSNGLKNSPKLKMTQEIETTKEIKATKQTFSNLSNLDHVGGLLKIKIRKNLHLIATVGGILILQIARTFRERR